VAALTTTRMMALFQALQVPYAVAAGHLDDLGLNSVNEAALSGGQAQTKILGHLTDVVYVDATLQAALEALLDAWIALGTDTLKWEGGSIGGVSGVTYDPNSERALLCDRIQVIVPFFRAQDNLAAGVTLGVPGLR